MEHESTTRHFVDPYGRQHVVQQGIAIRPSRSLRDRFVMVDSSEQDLNPEACYGLRKTISRK